MAALARQIRDFAREIGYVDCGVVPVGELAGYAEAVARLTRRFPESAAAFASGKRTLLAVRRAHPWAESVVICARRYGKYRIPRHLQGLIGKFYLTDVRHEKESAAYRNSRLFEDQLREWGLKTAAERDHGIVPYRWIAAKAGIGVIRKNNFFYTRYGSWVDFEAWLVDRELEIRGEPGLKPCPAACVRCVDACPSRSLAEPYMTNRESCISNITTWKGRDMPNERYREEVGQWIYGCDACQDACPFNAAAWTDDEEFPGLEELAGRISPEKIVAMDYAFLRGPMAEKFWYISPGDAWKWKVNALNAMLNRRGESCRRAAESALGDESPEVRTMAAFVLDRVRG